MPTAPRRALAALLVLAFPLLAHVPAAAQARDRLEIDVGWSRGVDRYNSIGADTLGIHFGRAYIPEFGVDFRVLDVPAGKKKPSPSLHVGTRIWSDERTVGPAMPGQIVGRYQLLGVGGSVYMDTPLDLVKGNTGVAFRLGWEGAELMTRSGPNDFLTQSMLRFGFVRTTGGMQGSYILVGTGVDEMYGYDAASGRWDVRLSLQGRIAGSPTPPAPPAKAGAKAPPAPKKPDDRVLWVFLEMNVNTDGGFGADGMAARAGVMLDVSAWMRNTLRAPARPSSITAPMPPPAKK
jgi:hypothetical protein